MEKKKNIKFQNVSQQEHIDVNILRQTIKEILTMEENNLEELSNALKISNEAKTWLELAEKNFKAKDKQFYEAKRISQLEATIKQIESFENQIKNQKLRVQQIQTYLDTFDNYVMTDIEETETEINTTFIYNWEMLQPLVELARIFNLGKNF